jgi:sugar/nucleoside kinase (ribokinase family)
MSLTVVGSIAFDHVTTPFGQHGRLLGGAATHFALAASFFERVRMVGCVGEDFGEADMRALRRRGTLVEDVERVPGGETFFWRGEYGWDLNSRETIETRLNVFADFEPKLSGPARDCDVLFLANIQPQLQRRVHSLCAGARLVALDSMDLWIETERDELTAAIAAVDCVILNDAELRQLTEAPNLIGAARTVIGWGPDVVVAKQGEYGAVLVTRDQFFSLPSYPLEKVVDPTGAGDTFAGGFLGYLAMHLDDRDDPEVLRRAMAYGTALASFNVEEFGTAGVYGLRSERVHDRVAELAAATSFEHAPADLVGSA